MDVMLLLQACDVFVVVCLAVTVTSVSKGHCHLEGTNYEHSLLLQKLGMGSFLTPERKKLDPNETMHNDRYYIRVSVSSIISFLAWFGFCLFCFVEPCVSQAG